MSKKSPRIAALIAECSHPIYSPYYVGYFRCFNAQLYYEAHDVLEELWLGRRAEEEARYYQGLIQFAGAFVHLQKNRLHPAARLFLLTLKNWKSYPDSYLGFNLQEVRELAQHNIAQLEKGEFKINPWTPKLAPQLKLL